MEDPSRDRAIDRIIYSVFSGIDWGSQQVKSACPSRERWSWKKIWDRINKFEKKEEEDYKRYQHPSQFNEKAITGVSVEHPEISRCGYQYCEIKMQDPCAPCCCALECIEPPPCTDDLRIDRTPRCECAKRKEIKAGCIYCDPCGIDLQTV